MLSMKQRWKNKRGGKHRDGERALHKMSLSLFKRKKSDFGGMLIQTRNFFSKARIKKSLPE
jgi:hypothetical protein